MSFERVGEGVARKSIFVPGKSPGEDSPRVNLSLNGSDVMPVRNHVTHELIGYRVRRGETIWEFDREGEIRSTRGLEAPLETPVVDPIDVVDMVVPIAKGANISVKALKKVLAKKAAVEGGETVEKLGSQGGGKGR